MAPASAVAEAAEVVLAHGEDEVEAAQGLVGEAIEPVEEVGDLVGVSLGEEELLDLIEDDENGPVGAVEGLVDDPLDGLEDAERLGRRRQPQVAEEDLEEPGDGSLVGRPAVDGDDTKVVVLVEGGEDGGLHDGGLAGAGGPEEGDAAVSEDGAGELAGDGVAAVEAVAVGGATGSGAGASSAGSPGS